MDISADAVKELREKTGVSVMECKKALVEAGGDMQKALAVLGARSVAMAAKKQDRDLGAGTVAAYVHNTLQVGCMALLLCETDFVSKNEEFVALAHDIAMHASAMRPESIEAVLAQPFIKDGERTIEQLIQAATQKFGERIELNKLEVFSVK
jgi:elongation factor Ts